MICVNIYVADLQIWVTEVMLMSSLLLFQMAMEMVPLFRGSDAATIVRNLAEISSNAEAQLIVKHITTTTTSCIQWATTLQHLMQNTKPLYVPKHGTDINPQVFDKVATRLKAGKTMLVGLHLTKGGDHVFAIEPLPRGEARVIQGWQGQHPLRVEDAMPVDKLVQNLKSLSTLDHVDDKAALEKTLGKLFGKDHAGLTDDFVRRKTDFTSIIEGSPRESLRSESNRARLRGLSKIIAPPDSRSSSSSLSGSDSSVSRPGSRLEDVVEFGGTRGKLASVGIGTAVGAGIGFVLGVGGSLIYGDDWEEAGLAGLRGGLGGAAAGGAATAVAKNTVPTFARAGTSIVRANAAAGVALFGVFAIWDVVEWKMNNITAVELRERLAAGSGAAAGGFLAGAAAGAAGGVVGGPIGAAIGAIIGGIAGSIAGTFAGKEIDDAIWDDTEDAVMNTYEFFGRHDVARNTRPIFTPEEIEEAFDKKRKEKPEEMAQADWDNICLANFMILVKAMYPMFEDLMKLANKVSENKSDAMAVVSKIIFELSQHEEEEEKTTSIPGQ